MRRGCAGLVLAIGILASPEAAPELGRPGVERRIGYDSAAPADSERSLDLYLPGPTPSKPPLFVFVDSRFWTRRGTPRWLDARVGRPLQSEGAAVAIVRHRLAPEHAHPELVRDVAAALAFLIRNAPRYGYDANRIVLAGHSSGGQLAALLALDPSYLAELELTPTAIAAVMPISAPLDLEAVAADPDQRVMLEQAFPDPEARASASPAALARADAPRFIVLAAQTDVPGALDDGLEFTRELRAAGHTDAETFRIPHADHLSILELDADENQARALVLEALGLQPLPLALRDAVAGRRRWRDPPISTEPFWELGAPVETHAASARFLAQLRGFFVGLSGGGRSLDAQRFHAIDLFDLLEARDPGSTSEGRYLITTNLRGERMILDLEAIRPYQPVLVVGVDERRNLFRWIDVSERRRQYSWRDAPNPPLLARPVGAFLHTLKEAPADLELTGPASFSLGSESFELGKEDPLGAWRDAEPELRSALMGSKGCLSCHALGGDTPRAGHTTLRDAAAHGGFALPLEEYPPEVLERFLREPNAVARELGSPPMGIEPAVAEKLLELVARQRRTEGQ